MDIKEQETMTANQMIAALIKERGLTLSQFCALVNKKPPNISKQLHDTYMSAKDWRDFAKALGYRVVMVPIEQE